MTLKKNIVEPSFSRLTPARRNLIRSFHHLISLKLEAFKITFNKLLVCAFCMLLSLSGFLALAVQDSRFMEALTKVELSKQQKEEVESLIEREKIALISVRASLRAKHNKLNSLLSNDSSSDQEIDRVKADINLLEEQLNSTKEQTRLSIKKVLTPSQRQELQDLQFNH